MSKPAVMPFGDDRFLEIPHRNFFGQFSHSPSGIYTIAWGKKFGSRGGVNGKGCYVLLQQGRILIEGAMMRPDYGAVADNGTFVLADHKRASALSGIFFAFGSDGHEIIRRSFRANIFNTGLSNDGQVAVCQTCNSLSVKDSSILALFDLSDGIEVANWIPESGWAQFYEFKTDRVGLGYRDLGVFYYSPSGEFIDRTAWQAACLTKGDYATTIMMTKRYQQGRSGDVQ